MRRLRLAGEKESGSKRSQTVESDIEKVRRSESRRGKRPKGLADERKKAIRTSLELATEEEFVGAMRAAGLQPDDPRFQAALAAWREYRSS